MDVDGYGPVMPLISQQGEEPSGKDFLPSLGLEERVQRIEETRGDIWLEAQKNDPAGWLHALDTPFKSEGGAEVFPAGFPTLHRDQGHYRSLAVTFPRGTAS